MEFNTPDTVAEFRDMFAEGKVNLFEPLQGLFSEDPRSPHSTTSFFHQELAEQSEILETVGDQDPSHFYYGQVALLAT